MPAIVVLPEEMLICKDPFAMLTSYSLAQIALFRYLHQVLVGLQGFLFYVILPLEL